MPWRHLQPLRKKRALAAASIDILPQHNTSTPKPLFPLLQDHGVQQANPRLQVNAVQIFSSLLQRCDSPASLDHGKRIHQQIIASGHRKLSQTPSLALLLIKMYGKCGSPCDAKAVFDDVCNEESIGDNISFWNCLLTAFVHNGKNKEGLSLYKDLTVRNLEPTATTLIQVLVACSTLRSLAIGKTIHSRSIATGLDRQVGVATTLIVMYGRCGCINEASRIFENLENRNLATWNAMLAANTQTGHPLETERLYRRMSLDGVGGGGDACTLSIVLSACTDHLHLRQIHARAIAAGLDAHPVVGTALVRGYGRWGSVAGAMAAFDQVKNKDVVCWTAIIAVMVSRGLPDRALDLYRAAIAAGIQPDGFTFSATCRDVDTGRQIHVAAARSRACVDDPAVGTALVAMYGRCQCIDEAKRAFDGISSKNVVSWNAILGVYADAGLDSMVMELFHSMDVEPDVLVFSKVLGSIPGDLAVARELHARIDRSGLGGEATIQNGLISMYARCGSWDLAKGVFDRCPRVDPVSWNAVISAAARFNRVDVAVAMLREMGGDGVAASEITFTSVLHCCAHAGDADQGVEIFKLLDEFGCGVVPDHFHCLIDLFGRLGMMEEAEGVADAMPFEPDLVAWTTLVGACKVHRDLDCAARCAAHIAELNTKISGPFMLLLSIWNDPEEEAGEV